MSPSRGGYIVKAHPRRLHRANQQSRASLGPNETDEPSMIGQDAVKGPLHPQRKTQPDPFREQAHDYVLHLMKHGHCAEQGLEMCSPPKEWLRDTPPTAPPTPSVLVNYQTQKQNSDGPKWWRG